MSNSTLLKDLLAHEQWANQQVIDMMHKCPTLPERALGLMAHIVAAQHIWIARIQQKPHTLDVFPTLELAECARYLEVHNQLLLEWASNQAMHNTALTYHTTTGASYTSTVEQMLTHLCLHSHYHRAQINQWLSPLMSTPNVDYINYLRTTL